MSLGLILGRAGAGKTTACIEQIGQAMAKGNAEEFVLLTPEQATFANEKRVLSTLGSAGGFHVKVLSFRRFMHFVLQETGGGLEPVLDTVGKSLVLRSLLEGQKLDLRAFQRVWDKRGFIGQLAEMMDELRTYRVSPEALLDCLRDNPEADKPPEDLALKLGDLQQVLAGYESFLAQGWLDLAGELSLLCQKLPGWPRLPHMSFWLDGFHGFTPAEFAVIHALLEAGRPVRITLTLPGGEEKRHYEEDELFYPTWETARSLQQICLKGGIAMEAPAYLGDPAEKRFAGSPDLAYLERMLAGLPAGAAEKPLPRPSSPAVLPKGDSEVGHAGAPAGCAIHLASCGDVRQEVERLAVEIREAAREGKLRYKDMAVLLRQPETYKSLMESILPAYDIPYFFDGPKPLRYHPLICLFRELTVFLRDRWNTGTLMAYVKTGFAGLTDHQGFALENYCLARGVQRMHWESRRPWRFTPSDEEGHSQADRYMERLRQKLWQPLERLRMELTGASTVEEAAAAVCSHLYSLKADEMCCRLAKEALERGEPETAQIHLRAWQELMKLFDQTVLFLALPEGSGEEDLPQLLASVWESGLEVAEMATLPPALDQVTICSMDRSRSPMAEKVWILGANEGVIPASMKQDNLLDAGERQWLASRQIHLAPDNRRRTFSEYYLIYIALTRASKSLNISCVRADIQGGSQAPSVLLEQLCRWFPGLTVDESELPVTRRLNHPRAGLQLLGLALQEAGAAGEEAGSLEEVGIQGRVDWAGRLEGAGAPGGGGNPADRITESLWRYVFRWFAGNRVFERDIQRLKAAYDLAPLGQPLPAALAEALFGRTIKTSVTRLEQYQACPFAHFLAYGLSLEPREEYAVEPPEIGNYFHDSLEALMGEVKSRGLALGALSRQEREELVEKVAAGQLEKKSHEIFLTSAWYRRLSNNLRRILQSSAGIMAYQENQGSFLSDAFEVAFGFDDMGGAPPISLDLGEGRQILLRGRIDRIDQATRYGEEAGERFLRVVDYKSGGMTLALHEIYYGLKLQLILYMEAALTAVPGAKPAGLFYFQIHDPILQAANVLEAGDEAWRMEKMLKTRAFRGYMLGDREVASLMDKDYEKSLFLPVSALKSGDFSRHAKVLSSREFALLGDYSRRVLNKAGQGIMEGDISLSPYRMGKKTACDFCPYPSVCRFDPVIRGHSFRYLPVLSDAVVRERLAAGAGGEIGFSAGARRGSILPHMHGGGGSTPQGGGGK